MKIMKNVFASKKMKASGALACFTGDKCEPLPINGNNGKTLEEILEEICGANAWRWISRTITSWKMACDIINWETADIGFYMYGAQFFDDPGILMCYKMDEAAVKASMPQKENATTADVLGWMSDHAKELQDFGALENTSIFVLSGDGVHTLCCFIPVTPEPDWDKFLTTLNAFMKFGRNYERLNEETAKSYGVPEEILNREMKKGEAAKSAPETDPELQKKVMEVIRPLMDGNAENLMDTTDFYAKGYHRVITTPLWM